MKKIKRFLSVSLFVVEGIPLLIYPFVLIADIMTIAGEWTGKENICLVIVILCAIIASASYPLTYIGSIIYFFNKTQKFYNNKWIPFAPLVHLIIVVLLIYSWSIAEKAFR